MNISQFVLQLEKRCVCVFAPFYLSLLSVWFCSKNEWFHRLYSAGIESKHMWHLRVHLLLFSIWKGNIQCFIYSPRLNGILFTEYFSLCKCMAQCVIYIYFFSSSVRTKKKLESQANATESVCVCIECTTEWLNQLCVWIQFHLSRYIVEYLWETIGSEWDLIRLRKGETTHFWPPFRRSLRRKR